MALLDDAMLTGRADLRRDQGELAVLASYPEPGADPARFADSLRSAVTRLQHQIAPE